MAVITNTTENTIVSGSSGADKINNKASNVTLETAEGNDSVNNIGSFALINVGSGNNTVINNNGNNVTINAGAGNNYINSYGDRVSISSDSGDDKIVIIYGENLTINAGDGNDSIDNRRVNYSFISGGKGNDTILNNSYQLKYGLHVTIDSGDGDDSIQNYGSYTSINSGSGDDKIHNYNITGNVTIESGAGNDSVYSYANQNLISSGEGNDTIQNHGDTVTVDSGVGNDYIYNYAMHTTINSGEGNDTIENVGLHNLQGHFTSINGGAGNDYIKNSAAYVTINTGSGDDTIVANSDDYSEYGEVFQHVEGNDVIIDYGDNDTIQLIDNEIRNFSVIGNDFIINLDKGSIKLKDINYSGDNYFVNQIVTFKLSDGNLTTIATADYLDVNENVYIVNYINDQQIQTGLGNDKIYNRAQNSTIITDAGNDTISGDFYDSSLINAGSGNDSIRGSGNNMTIYAGEGNDYIQSYGDNILINARIGTNSIVSGGSNTTINAGDGDDSIYTYSNFALVNSGAGNDTIDIISSSKYDKISNITVDAGVGDDYINNFGSNVLINGGDGNDTIKTAGYSVSINGGSGNDSIISTTNNTTINGGVGNDTIVSSGLEVIQYSEGNDVILNYSERDTLDLMNNEIKSFSIKDNDIIISTDNGSINLKDTVGKILSLNLKLSDGTLTTIQAADYLELGDIYFNNYDANYRRNDREIKTGAGNDTIKNGGENVTITTGAGNDSVYNYSYYRTKTDVINAIEISTGSGNDTIQNYGSKVSINAGDDNDYIVNARSVGLSPFGDDDDSPYYPYEDVTIDGGAGNDTIYSRSQNVIIRGGKGNDSVGGNNFIYEYSEGDDTISAYAKAINITSGTISESVVSGNNLIFKIGTGSITVINGKDRNIPLITFNNYSDYWRDMIIDNAQSDTVLSGGNNPDRIFNRASNVTINGGAGDDVIRNSIIEGVRSNNRKNYPDNVVIYGGSGDDNITNKGANSTIDGGEGNDYIYNYASLNAVYGGNGDDFISNYFDTVEYLREYDDTNNPFASTVIGSIIHSGSNSTLDGGAGNDTVSNRVENVIITTGAGNDSVYNGGNNTSISTGIGNDTIITGYGHRAYDSIVSVQKADAITINAGLDNDIVTLGKVHTNNLIQYLKGDGDDTIYGYNETDTIEISGGKYVTQLSGNNIIIKVSTGSMTFVDAADKTLNIVGALDDGGNGDSDFVYLTNKTKSPYDAEDSVTGIDASERTKAIRIVGNANDNIIIGTSKNDTFTGGVGDDTFVANGGKDIVTDYAEGDIVSLTGALSKVAVSGKNAVLTSGKNSITLKDVKGKKVTFVDGDGNVTRQTFGVAELQIVDGDGASINAANDAAVITLDASERTENISLIGNSKANTLIGGAGDDELTGGKGKDLFVYNGQGNDIITDYAAGQDRIKLDGVEIQSVSYTGEQETDLVIQTENGTLTIENAVKLKSVKGKITRTPQKITITDKDDFTTSLIYGGDTLTADNSSGDTLKAVNGFNILDASKRSKNITLIGNDSANTLIGGKKNDTLTGGGGADTFVYTTGNGNDVITDYSADDGDIIKLGKKTYITEAVVKDDDYIFTIGKGKITVQGGANQIINFVDANENSITFAKSARNFNEIFNDDNFSTSQLDEISVPNNLISESYNFNEELNFKLKNQLAEITSRKFAQRDDEKLFGGK